MNLQDFKQKNPAYANVPDEKLADALYNKFYAQKMPRDQFNKSVGFSMTQSTPNGVQPQSGSRAQGPQAPQPSAMNAAPQPTDKPKEQTGIVGTVKQYAPAVAHGLVGAGAGMADLATTVPYNVVQEIGHMIRPDKPARDLPSISEAAQKGLTNLGVPESQTPAQRAVEYGTEFLAGGGAGAAKDVLKGGVAAAKYATSGEKILNDLTKLKNSVYDAAKTNTALHPDDTANLLKDLRSIKDLQTEQGVSNNLDVSKAIGSIESKADPKTGMAAGNTLNNLLQVRKALNESNSGAATEAKKTLDSYLKNRAVRDRASGSSKDFEQFDKANELNRQLKSTQTFLKIMNKEDTSAPEIKAALKKILKDPEQMKYYPPNIRELIKAGSKGKTSGNILQIAGALRQYINKKTAGGLLGIGELGALAGGAGASALPALLGAGAAYAGSAAARGAATNVAKGTVANIIEAISKGM